MKKIPFHIFYWLCAAVLLSPTAGAQDYEEAEEDRTVKIFGEFQNIVYFQTDRDVDDSEPAYHPYGQSVGFFGTYVNPEITLTFNQGTTIFYEGEVGINIWSRNHDSGDLGGADSITIHHRQLFGEGKFNSRFQFRVGYQYVEDPTGLFLGHWLGSMNITLVSTPFPISLTLGQLPDQTHEGWDADENNFQSDIFVSSVSTDTMIGERWSLSGGIYYVYNGEMVDHAEWLVTPVARIVFATASLEAGWDTAIQYGEAQQGAYGNLIERTVAWATQGYITGNRPPVELEANLLLLSGDDQYDHNGNNFAFHYSGKSLSATRILSEDELRDWGNNIDERIGEYDGGFYRMRSGLLLIDGRATLDLGRNATATLITGGAATLKEQNALNNHFIGIETDLILQYLPTPHIRCDLANGVFFPGKAVAAYINGIDPGATHPVYRAEAAMSIIF